MGKPKQETRKRALKKEEVLKIAELEVKHECKAWHMRNMFLFSYYCKGINFSHIAFLKRKEIIVEDKIVYTRKQTGTLFHFRIPKNTLDILHYYKEVKISPYVFPILSDYFHQG
ncbi:hypothetical protein R9C00_16375 [Flammeovirgaceae bacterium SG7u.111]|nr:hypothetical protein [Flammeovirgaceae bacterium SG7u.132]WPO33279.1 hypothetical protein R9C00_16375 [Flammeovirgaceae bacterium SG7u.111]